MATTSDSLFRRADQVIEESRETIAECELAIAEAIMLCRRIEPLRWHVSSVLRALDERLQGVEASGDVLITPP